MEKPSLFERFSAWVRRSVTLKLLSIGFLILVLLIPSEMISSLVREREEVRNEAVKEVSSKWGQDQTIGGPVLTVPYTAHLTNEKGQSETVIRYAHFLPETLSVNGSVAPEKRYRGIYVVVLYNGKIHVKGDFRFPDTRSLGIDQSDYKFDEAFVSLGISDMKGVNSDIRMKWNDSTYSFNPGIPTNDIFSSGASIPVDIKDKQSFAFDFNLDLNGSSSLYFLPFGKETNVHLSSTWKSPSFEGYTLPDKRSVTDQGFEADWLVTQLNRNYPQQGLGSFINTKGDDEVSANSSDAGFGVRLMLPVDEYQKTFRSVKYCLMFIVITFITFFFVEVLSKKRIHPIQYLLVGFAICLFYVLLLSISEHLRFNSAYLIGCISILSLITFYASHVFRDKKLTAMFSTLLALLYGFFYSLLQLEDYALLLGSIGLFLILASIMYLTRKINWYSVSDDGDK
jgi:inner membrane protein